VSGGYGGKGSVTCLEQQLWPRFDALAAAAGAWLLGGIFLDGWAHNHIHVDTFFTPWHAILYTGFFANAALFGWAAWRGRREGAAWRHTVPPGYHLAALGLPIFMLSGIGDLLWHVALGIEKSVSAGFSPPRLGIMVSTGMIVSGPFSSAWGRTGCSRNAPLASVVSVTLAMSLTTFVFQYADPLVVVSASLRPVKFHDQALGAVSILLRALIVMGWILTLARRWELKAGSLTLMLGANALAMCCMRGHFLFVPALLAAGLAADFLYSTLRPGPSSPIRFHFFAFAVPVLVYCAYFGALSLSREITWPIPLWSGTILMAGIVCALESLLVLPADFPRSRR
jgi:hypothetical protein